MKYDVISFDLQGTISDAAFSDEFWIELLPALYAEKNQVSLVDSKKHLKECFKEIGRYDTRYYSFDHWLKTIEMEMEWQDLLKRVKTPPSLYHEMITIIHAFQAECPLLLFSATSHQFIYHELGALRESFSWIVSALDDLKVPGKPPESYKKLAAMVGAAPERILHIGDDYQMDVENARLAGWDAFHINTTISREENVNKLFEYMGVHR